MHYQIIFFKIIVDISHGKDIAGFDDMLCSLANAIRTRECTKKVRNISCAYMIFMCSIVLLILRVRVGSHIHIFIARVRNQTMMSRESILRIKSLHIKDPEVEENESRSDPSNLYTVNTDTPGKLKNAV